MAFTRFREPQWQQIQAFLREQEGALLNEIRAKKTPANCIDLIFVRAVVALAPNAPEEIRGLLTEANMIQSWNLSRLHEYLRDLISRHPGTVGISGSSGTKKAIEDALPSLRGYAGKALNTNRVNPSPLYLNGIGGGTAYYHKTSRTKGVGKAIDGGHPKTSTPIYIEDDGEYHLVAWAAHTAGGSAVYQVQEVVEGCDLEVGDILRPKLKKP